MDRRELLALKLQMGIAPSTQIELNVLRAMWQQLKLENANVQGNRSNMSPPANPLTDCSMYI